MRASLSFLCAGLLLTAACKKNDDPNKAGYWVDRLSKRDGRAEALQNLGRIADKAAYPDIVKWLHEEGEWQPDAAIALGQLGDQKAVPELEKEITEEVVGQDKRARDRIRTNLSIVRALAMLKATSAAPHIAKLLRAGDDRVREAALTALGQLGDPKNADLLIDTALNEKSPIVRVAAIRALGELGAAKGVPALIQDLFVEDNGVPFYAEARLALVMVGPAAVQPLVATLNRQNKDVEDMRIGGQPLPEGVIEAKAGSVLGALKAQEAEAPLAAALTKTYKRLLTLKPKDGAAAVPAALSIEMAYALGSLGGNAASAALVPLTKDPRPELRLAACEALTQLGDHDVVPALIASARQGDIIARRAALLAASRLGMGTDIAAFDTLAKPDPTGDIAPMVQAERVRLLAAKDCQATAACWKKKLADKDSKVRERAAYELGWLGQKDATGDLLTAAEDPDAEVRMAAVLSLGRMTGLDAGKLQHLYDQWESKREYAGVNDELLRLIARVKSSAHKK